jgi:dihydrofolate synthase / folylpolyglutamate synthase
MNTLQEQLRYMYALERFGMKPELDSIRRLLKELGNPHEQFASVHISGTNGKGSTAAFLEAALRLRYRVGLYTSPHLVRFNERIRVNGMEIPDEQLGALIERVQHAANAINVSPTFFEFSTALAFSHFAHERVNIGVIEVGLGGEKDATNVITPLVAVITNIGHDHAQIIGPTKLDIAREKAGIIKKGSVCVTAEADVDMFQVLAKKAEERGAACRRVQEMLSARVVEQSLDGQIIETRGAYSAQFTLPLLGEHQVTNAATALIALQALAEKGFGVSLEQIQAGFRETRWPGRLHVLSRRPLILVDGAHNEEGAQALASFVQTSLESAVGGKNPWRRVLLLGMKNDKHMPTMFETLLPTFERVIVTEGNYEPTPARALASVVAKYHPGVEAIPNVRAALAAGTARLEADDLVLVTGSLYLVGDVLATMRAPVGKPVASVIVTKWNRYAEVA